MSGRDKILRKEEEENERKGQKEARIDRRTKIRKKWQKAKEREAEIDRESTPYDLF